MINSIASIPFMRSRDCQCVEHLKSLRVLYAALVAAIAQIQQQGVCAAAD
jgi:hypothetical protein